MAEHTAVEIPAMTGELRPVRTAFFFQRLAPVALGIVVVTTVASIAIGYFQPPGIAVWQVAAGGMALLIVWLVAAGAWASVAYSKERYEFHDHRIIAHCGSPISDRTNELTIRNITHVKRRLPWPRYPLFGVGDVMIESAGSDASEITLRTIRRPDEVYEGVASLMRENGFQLTRRELLHQERPDFLAVVIECLGMAVAAFIATVIALGELFFGEEGGFGIKFGIALLPLLGLVAIVFHFLDMRRRVYRVYADTVVYEEGFLTRDDAFIPGENIADSSTRRGLLDMILGLFDVQISCQGSRAEIAFRRLRQGTSLSSAVEQVVSRATRAEPEIHAAELVSDTDYVGDRDDTQVAALQQEPLPRTAKISRPPAVPEDQRWTSTLTPSIARWLAPYVALLVLVFPLWPFWLIFIMRGLINASCTRYMVRSGSVQERFQFLKSTERDFSYDKVTGAVIRKNPFDRLFGTVTISIWSIGSAQPLELKHVVRKNVEMDALLRQLGIPEADVVDSMPSKFSVPRMILATIPTQIAICLGILGIVILGAALDWRWFLALIPVALVACAVIAHRMVYYPCCSVVMHRSHVECREGWLWRQHFFARHDNIKRVELMRFPRADVGVIRFVVAGEHRPGSNPYATRKKMKGLESLDARSYGFQVRYAEHVRRYATLIDERLSGISFAEDAVEHESGPALANPLAVLLPLSILIVPMILLLPFTIPWTVLAVRRRRYFVEPYRVLMKSGIIYRRQASILHDRIDSIRRNQNLLGKVFGNGSVTIFTAGSSKPDLELENARDFRDLYTVLQKHYTD